MKLSSSVARFEVRKPLGAGGFGTFETAEAEITSFGVAMDRGEESGFRVVYPLGDSVLQTSKTATCYTWILFSFSAHREPLRGWSCDSYLGAPAWKKAGAMICSALSITNVPSSCRGASFNSAPSFCWSCSAIGPNVCTTDRGPPGKWISKS